MTTNRLGNGLDAGAVGGPMDKDGLHYGLLRYDSMTICPPWWLLILHRVFGTYVPSYYALGWTYAALATNITNHGIEPGYRAVQTTENGGKGIDFIPLDPERRSKCSWLSSTPEPRSTPEVGQ